jgi:hypothetical protein
MSDSSDNTPDYAYLLNKFGEEVIKDRFEFVRTKMEIFIEKSALQGKVQINDEILSQCIIDYFADIQRLKEFHDIEKTQKDKCVSYLSYWILYRKPLQVCESMDEYKKTFVNEKFVYSSLIMAYLNEICNISVNAALLEFVADFKKTAYYYLKYRKYCPQGIELMLQSFKAGLCCRIKE